MSSTATKPQVLYSLKNIKKHYPVKGGIFKTVKGHVKAVDGITLDIYKAHLYN